jgi:hypothetical protein
VFGEADGHREKKEAVTLSSAAQNVTAFFSQKKFCNVFRSDAQRRNNTSVDAPQPSAHNALTSLHQV